MVAQKPIRAGIVGFGRMAEHHLTRMRESEDFEVVGVCDITPARRAAAVASGLQATERLDDFLEWDLELAVVATHSVRHHADACACLAAGRHVLVEKPMAVSADQAQEMVDLAGTANRVLAVYHNRHFDADYRMVKKAVIDGLVGDVVTVENRTASSRPAHRFGTPDYNPAWRITAVDGGGTLLDFGPHWVEQILDLLAPRKVKSIFADVRNIAWGDADDHFTIHLVFTDGTRATAGKSDVSWGDPRPKWLLLGTKATLHGPEDDRIVVNGDGWELRRTAATDAQSLHGNIAQAIRNGSPLVIPPVHALRVMRVLQAARDSATSGVSVNQEI